MFSNEERCLYNKNPLVDVICQLRFPEILRIATSAPAEFQDEIRKEYPHFSARKDTTAPIITGRPGNFSLENRPAAINYHFTSLDGVWLVNLTTKFISLSCRKYTRWEDFAGRLDCLLSAFIKIYQPACFERIGLRYLNAISRNALDMGDSPFDELIQPAYLGPLANQAMEERHITRCSIDMEAAIQGGCNLKLHAGPGRIKRNGVDDGEVKFIFDQDLYMEGNVPVNYAAGALQTLHSQAFPIFRGGITSALHHAMEPETI